MHILPSSEQMTILKVVVTSRCMQTAYNFQYSTIYMATYLPSPFI
jgi:hypothetical protein